MTTPELVHHRLSAQRIEGSDFKRPIDVVRWFGAIQAQDYLGALWAVGLRLPKATEGDIEEALASREILRTWPMRGTLHFVAAEDARWMLELMAPRIVARQSKRLADLGLDAVTLNRSRKILERVLRDGKQLSRPEVYRALDDAGIATSGQRGINILWRIAQDGVICFGPRSGKQQTFTLLDAWVPRSKKLAGDEALAELATRYFQAHGPATLHDLAWWSGLSIAECKRAIEIIKLKLVSDALNFQMKNARALGKNSGQAHLLPAFDEYLVGYKDRTAVLGRRLAAGGGGILAPTLVVDGQVVGTWTRALSKKGVKITMKPFGELAKAARSALELPIRRYDEFLQTPRP